MKPPKSNQLAILGAKDGQFPKRAITLLEIMLEINASKIHEFVGSIDLGIEKIREFTGKPLPQSKVQAVMVVLEIKTENGFLQKTRWFTTLQEMGWDDAFRRWGELCMAVIGKNPSSESIFRLLSELNSAIHRELESRKFAMLEEAKAGFFEQKALFGKQVEKAFPSAKEEIRAAGNCLAMDLKTAAVFHLMRVAELGMRALARHLKVKAKNNAIDSAGWTEIIKHVGGATAARWQKLPKAKVARRKAVAFLKFCEVSADELNVFKEVWRNNVMHAGQPNNEHEAHGVYIRVKDFMRRLSANGISEKKT